VFPSAQVERLWTGCRWAEGPAWFAAGRYLVWSDIPNDRMLRWDETDGSVSVFRQPALNTNGHTVDLQGRLVSCEHRGRCVSRTEHDGTRTVLASQWQGRRLNSPNDVVVKSDGSIWFSDPSYGIDSDYEGDAAPNEQGAQRVYRLDPDSGALTVAADDFMQPNGLAFSPDESLLYVTDTGATHRDGGPRHVRRFRVGAGGALSGGEVLATCVAGLYDGLRVDVHGHLWLSAGDGVHCHAADGTRLGTLRIPEPVANLCFGGPKRNRLFVCATTSLYAVYLNTRGAR
jgi:gluconolactonase